MSMTTKSIAEIIKERRSIRKLKKPENLTTEKVNEILKVALYTPSAFSMQSARLILLTGDENTKFWNIVKEEVKKSIPAGQDFAPTEEKLNGFSGGFGTVLYFENKETIKGMQESFPLYAGNFPKWGEQSNGMLQHSVWMLFAAEGIAASLQHYSPLIDERVKKEWNVPESWKLIAQMPFGEADEKTGDRSFLAFEEVVKVY